MLNIGEVRPSHAMRTTPINRLYDGVDEWIEQCAHFRPCLLFRHSRRKITFWGWWTHLAWLGAHNMISSSRLNPLAQIHLVVSIYFHSPGVVSRVELVVQLARVVVVHGGAGAAVGQSNNGTGKMSGEWWRLIRVDWSSGGLWDRYHSDQSKKSP